MRLSRTGFARVGRFSIASISGSVKRGPAAATGRRGGASVAVSYVTARVAHPGWREIRAGYCRDTIARGANRTPFQGRGKNEHSA